MRLSFVLPIVCVLAGPAWADGREDAAQAGAATEARDFAEASRLYTRALADKTLEPRQQVIVLLRRAAVLKELARYPDALADLDLATKTDKDFGMRADNSGRKVAILILYNRGIVHEAMERYDLAIADYDEAIRRDPGFSWPKVNRGNVHRVLGNCGKADADYAAALELYAKDSLALSNRAWLLATCPDAKSRDGARAVALARDAIAITDHPYFEGILAAALAESGAFTEAVEVQERAITLLDPADTAMQGEFRKRLTAYEQKKPWRDVPKTATGK